MPKGEKKSKKRRPKQPQPGDLTHPRAEPAGDAEVSSASPANLVVEVGPGTLAGDVLASIEALKGDLERIYGQVAALGRSLALAREQLAEQEEELEAIREQSAAPELVPSAPAPERPFAAPSPRQGHALPGSSPGSSSTIRPSPSPAIEGTRPSPTASPLT